MATSVCEALNERYLLIFNLRPVMFCCVFIRVCVKQLYISRYCCLGYLKNSVMYQSINQSINWFICMAAKSWIETRIQLKL